MALKILKQKSAIFLIKSTEESCGSAFDFCDSSFEESQHCVVIDRSNNMILH